MSISAGWRKGRTSMAAEQKGLYDKYMVIKVVDGTVIENCFILRPDKDPAAVKALQAYAAATENKALANDIYAWVGKPMLKPLKFEWIADGPVYIEYAKNEKIECVLFDPDDHAYAGMIMYHEFGSASRNYVQIDYYGKYWRAWDHMPTEEERAAAPWEE